MGCAFSDRIEALLDGRVRIDGYDLAISIAHPHNLFRDALTNQTFDLVERSLGTHIAALSSGKTDYVALPIFLSRAFRHSNIYVHSYAGIEKPIDLVGKRVGISDYSQTAGIWVRGLLAEDYGVARNCVQWITGGLHVPVAKARLDLAPPAGVHITHSLEPLNDLLARGDIDALISPTVPNCFRDGEAPVNRLFEDYRDIEIAYYNRTGIFPIMHCLVARKSMLSADPKLGAGMCDAFAASLIHAQDDLNGRDYAKVTLPWLVKYHEETMGWLGDDLWTYGVETNRASLDTFLRFVADDGLSRGTLSANDIFYMVSNSASV